MEDKVRKNYFNKANRLIEALTSDEIEDVGDEEATREIERDPVDVEDRSKKAPSKSSYGIDEEGDIETETAKAILSSYIDKCVAEGVQELGDDHGLNDIEGSSDIVQSEIERIAKQVRNYLKSVQ